MISTESTLTHRNGNDKKNEKPEVSVSSQKVTKNKLSKSFNTSTLLSFVYLVTGFCFYLYSFRFNIVNQPHCLDEKEEHGYLAKAMQDVDSIL